jgi:hypothetical protein
METDTLQLNSTDGSWMIPSGMVEYTPIWACPDEQLHQVLVFAACTSTSAEFEENMQNGVWMEWKESEEDTQNGGVLNQEFGDGTTVFD